MSSSITARYREREPLPYKANIVWCVKTDLFKASFWQREHLGKIDWLEINALFILYLQGRDYEY